MALEVVKQYTKFVGNDIVIYVGEGVGGANANDEFFDFFLNHQSKEEDEIKDKWVLLESIDVEDVLGGGKGFEKLFTLKRIR